jgi:hypothetical protein
MRYLFVSRLHPARSSGANCSGVKGSFNEREKKSKSLDRPAGVACAPKIL